MGHLRKILEFCLLNTAPGVYIFQNTPEYSHWKVAVERYCISDAEKRLCAQTCFPKWPSWSFVILSITDAGQCMPVRRARAVSGSENTVKLSSASSNAFERSSCSDDKWAPGNLQNSKSKTPPDNDLLNKISDMCFYKLHAIYCFHMHENTSISIKLVLKQV